MQKLFFESASTGPLLSPLVKSCWIMRSSCGDRQEVPDLLIPDGFPELIFIYRGGYRKVALHDPRKAQEITASCLVGVQTETQLVTRLSPVHIVGLKLDPIGLYQLLPAYVAQSAHRNVPLDTVESKWLPSMRARLQSCNSASEVKAALLRLLPPPPDSEPAGPQLTRQCLRTLLEAKGNLSIKELARRHHRSVRQLQRYFKQYTGITPKQFARLIRFKALYKNSVLRQIQPRDYFRYGYFDQMHFIKDFKAHLGVTPSSIADASFKQKNKIARISQG